MSLINIGKDIWLELNRAKMINVSEDAKMLFNLLIQWAKNKHDGTYEANVMLADLIKAFELKGKKICRQNIGKLANELRKVKVLQFKAWDDGGGHEYILGEKSQELIKIKEIDENIKNHNLETANVTDVGKKFLSISRQMIKEALDKPNEIPSRLEMIQKTIL